MAEYNYLKPKVRHGNMGERKRINGMFQNTAPYPQYAGFNAAARWPEADRPLSLEKGDLTRKGKPV